ncbi:MAG: Glycosyl transferase [Cenarchaeum symbiont of Oopsacas minuta]|nr:Glycosyl transferase [Cenarchaeum symbiont of Oopsacas minuta]
MIKIGNFVYPWGNGHYSRMMRLHDHMIAAIADAQMHYISKPPIYEKIQKRFAKNPERIHKVSVPTPIDGKFGPSLKLSMLNITMPTAGNPPLIKQIADYLREERAIYNKEKFDLVINDGDMGSNVLAEKRNIPSLFVTNQFRPKLWKSRAYLYPGLFYISKQIAKASKILVADSAPPYTICDYNLNFPNEIMDKVLYVGHFAPKDTKHAREESDLERLIRDVDYGYWMRTGNKVTNEGTGERYNKIFARSEMSKERRIISYAQDNPLIDSVLGYDGKKYSISDAYEKRIDWLQIDVGFLSEPQKETVLHGCKYAVVNGSHTVMGEIIGGKAKPIIGIPIYDEHENNIRWAQEKNLGVLAKNTKETVLAVAKIHNDYSSFSDALEEFSRNFDGNGASRTAKEATVILENKR